MRRPHLCALPAIKERLFPTDEEQEDKVDEEDERSLCRKPMLYTDALPQATRKHVELPENRQQEASPIQHLILKLIKLDIPICNTACGVDRVMIVQADNPSPLRQFYPPPSPMDGCIPSDPVLPLKMRGHHPHCREACHDGTNKLASHACQVNEQSSSLPSKDEHHIVRGVEKSSIEEIPDVGQES